MKSIATQKYEILNKLYLSNSDIQILMEVGETKASQLRQQCLRYYNEKGSYFPYRKSIPTRIFLEYFDVDTDLIYKHYRLERELNARN